MGGGKERIPRSQIQKVLLGLPLSRCLIASSKSESYPFLSVAPRRRDKVTLEQEGEKWLSEHKFPSPVL